MVRGFDHLVLASRDLGAQADLYRRLGFTVGARNRHPWGTINHIVQMPGCFLELLSTADDFVAPRSDEPVAQFAGFLADYLARREGLAMIVLESRDAEADQRLFQAAGIAGPSTFHFGRRGTRPDGSIVEVAFTLAFAGSPHIGSAGFFVCQQHHPENFWSPALQVHDNGVTGVDAVILAAAQPERHLPFLTAFTGGEVQPVAGGAAVVTPRGRIEVLDPETAWTLYRVPVVATELPRFVAVHFACPDPGAVARLAETAGVGLTRQARAAPVVLDVAQCFGVALAFGPAATPPV